jgi:hypothetical protein
MASRWEVIMTDSLPDPRTSVILIKTLEQHLLRIRMRLGDSLSRLKLANHASVVCTAACRRIETDCDEEVTRVLFNVVTHARLGHIASTKWGKRRYLVMDALLNPAKQEAAA